MPAEPVTGVNAVTAWPDVTVADEIACVAVTAPLTVSWNALLALAPLASVTVTVKVDVACVTVGLPVMAPVEALSDRPPGKASETL